MRPRTEIPAAQLGAIRRAMLAARNTSTFQRLQCLWLRAKQQLSTEVIAQTVGLSISHVTCGGSGQIFCGADCPPPKGDPKADAIISTSPQPKSRRCWLRSTNRLKL